MTVRQVIRYSVLLPVAFTLFVLVMMGRDGEFDYAGAIAISAFGFIVWLVGLVIGVLISAIARKPYREHWFYLAGQVIAISAVVYLFVRNTNQNLSRENNSESNHSFVNRHLGADTVNGNLQKAFLKLESSFKDPNSFRLRQFQTSWEDTVVNQQPDSVFVVVFIYNIQKNYFASKVTVLHDTPRVEIFNGPAGELDY